MDKPATGLLARAIENPKTTNAVIAIIGAALLALYAILATLDSHFDLWIFGTISHTGVKIVAIFAKEIGLAAVVAVLINFSIEAFNRKRHDKEKHELIETINQTHQDQRDAQIKAVNERIFQTVYERNIPHEFFKAIEEQMLRSRFIRTSSEFDLEIDRYDENHVILVARHTYFLKNVTSSSEKYQMALHFDVIKTLRDLYKITVFELGELKLDVGSIDIAVEDRSVMHEWWSVVHEGDFKAGETKRCIVEYTHISPMSGKEALCSILPTEKMTVQVLDRTCSFSVRGMSLHPRPEIPVAISSQRGRYKWEVDGALFPGQGFLIDWTPSITDANASSRPVAGAVVVQS